MKSLPKYWVVERTKDNKVLFKQTVIQYLSDTYREYWRGDSYRFYGYDGNSDFKGTNGWNSISKFENNPTLLTLDEFIKFTTKEDTMINFKVEAAKKQGMIKEEFVQYTLDELVGDKSVVVYIDSEEEWNKLKKTGEFNMCKYYGKYCYSLAEANFSSTSTKTSAGDYRNVKIITVDQIKFNETMNKEIIGYKLKKDCQQYLEAAKKIAGYITNPDGKKLEWYLEKPQWGVFKEKLEKAGVLDLWFEPVYKEEYKYKVGDWVVVLPEDKFYHNCEQGCAQQIVNIDFNKPLPYRLKFSHKGCNEYSKIRLATPEEIKKATTKEFSIGDYKAIVKDGNIIIDGKGKILVESFNDFYEEYLQDTLTSVDGYDIVLTTATIKIGCVRNVTLEQAGELYNYTKTL